MQSRRPVNSDVGGSSMTLHEDVFRTIAAIEATGATTEEEIVDELMTRGYDRLRAEILAVFVPMGLARAVIARLPVGSSIRLPENAVICDFERNRQLQLKLAAVPEFEAARHIGEETFASGVIPRNVFRIVVDLSIELKLINRLLDAGRKLEDSRFAAPHLLRLADAPGFSEWYETISTRSN